MSRSGTAWHVIVLSHKIITVFVTDQKNTVRQDACDFGRAGLPLCYFCKNDIMDSIASSAAGSS